MFLKVYVMALVYDVLHVTTRMLNNVLDTQNVFL